jgi:hypothetical protein
MGSPRGRERPSLGFVETYGRAGNTALDCRGRRGLTKHSSPMITIRASLMSGPEHPGFTVGTSVEALLFVKAPDLASAEEMAKAELSKQGWARVEIERGKVITDYSQFDGRDDVLAQAFREALGVGVGQVIYP